MTQLPESLRRVLSAKQPQQAVPPRPTNSRVSETTVWRDGTVIRDGKKLRSIDPIP